MSASRGCCRNAAQPPPFGREALDELAEMADRRRRDAVGGAAALAAPHRQPGLREAELGGFLEPRVAVRDGPHPAAQPDLAEDDRVGRHRCFGQRRDQRRGDREVGRRFADPQAPGDVEIDVVGADRQPATRIEHRRDHRQPRRVPADDRAARRPKDRRRDQRLDLDQHRARALDAGEDGGAGDGLLAMLGVGALGEEHRRGVRHLDEAAVAHLEDADLVGGAKAVLDRAQDAELMASFALEIKHRVDHVLEHARPGDRAFLGDVPDQHQDKAATFGERDQFLRRAAYLADRTGGAVQGVEIHRLDRIDDRKLGRVDDVERSGDVADAGRDREAHRRAFDTEAAGAQTNLVDRLLARDVGRGAAARRDRGGGLKQ